MPRRANTTEEKKTSRVRRAMLHKINLASKAEIARGCVAIIRDRTFCARCGKQPIEWHNPEHDKHPLHRVTELVARGYSLERIQDEIAVSTPLCRACHMKEDGRNPNGFKSRRNGA
jgi:hypothetical protein